MGDLKRCVICDRDHYMNGLMCGPCGRSYDRNGIGDGSVLAALEWAAGRARRFARRPAAPAPEPGRAEGERRPVVCEGCAFDAGDNSLLAHHCVGEPCECAEMLCVEARARGEVGGNR